MTHHFGEPDPGRPGSLFEKPTRTSTPPASRDGDEASTGAAAADAASGDGGRADDAPETAGGGADRAADEGRDVRGAASRPADDRRDAPANEGRDESGIGANGPGPTDGAAADPPTTAWDRPSAEAARDGQGGDVADRRAPAWERPADDVPGAENRAVDGARDGRVAGAGGGDVADRRAPAWERAADDVPVAGGGAADGARDGRGGAAGAAALGGVGAGRPAPEGKPLAADDQATAAVPAAGDPVDRQAPGWNHSAVDPFATAPMPATRSGGSRQAPHPQPAHTLVDDAPTEAMPVVEPVAADAVPEWRPPKQTSRLTTILIIALLVAVGFLAGVFVGRAAAPAPTGGEQPQPAATSSARPGAFR